MTAYGSSSGIETVPPPLWVCTFLGIFMIAASTLALADIRLAAIISVRPIGLTVVAVGAFEIILLSHGFAWLLYALRSVRATA